MAFDINLMFSNYGMSPAKLSLGTGNNIVFNDNDYFIVEPCKGSSIYADYYDSVSGTQTTKFDRSSYAFFNGYASGSSITANFLYKGNEIGLILRYSYSGFLIARFDGTYVSLYSVVNQSVEQIGRRVQCSLVNNSTYKIAVEDDKNKIKVFINDSYKTNFIINEDIITEGLFGVYASKGNECINFSVQSTIPDSWNATGDIVSVGYSQDELNDSGVMVSYYGDNTSESNYLSQTIPVSQTKCSIMFTVGCENNIGLSYGGKIQVYDVTHNTKIYEQQITKPAHYLTTSYINSFNIVAGCTSLDVRVVPSSNSTVYLEKLQVNAGDQKPFIKTYDVAVTEQASIIDLPVKIDSLDDINIALKVKPYSNLTTTKNVLFSFNDDSNTKYFIMYYDQSNKVCIDYIVSGTTYPYTTQNTLDMLEFNDVQALFKDGIIMLTVNAGTPTKISSSNPSILIPDFDITSIHLGYTEQGSYSRANGAFDEISISKGNSIISRYDFDGAIQETITGVPVYVPGKPTQFAPIAVAYTDGTALHRISSFDENGKYTKMATESVTYAGQKKISVSCYDIDSEYNMPMARVEGTNIVFYATKVDGNIIYFNMTDEQSVKYIGKPMLVSYVPTNSYSIRYEDDNAFTVYLHSHNGKNIQVSYEEAESEKTLIESANMNPFFNPNHSGFLYLSDELTETSYIDVTVTPNYIDGRSGEYALIIIDAYDSSGNIVSNADFSIKSSGIIGADIKRIATGHDLDTLGLGLADIQFSAGRYIYSYKLRQTSNSKSSYVIKDVITIVENTTNVTESTNIFIYT